MKILVTTESTAAGEAAIHNNFIVEAINKFEPLMSQMVSLNILFKEKVNLASNDSSKRCIIEAQLAGVRPVNSSCDASEVEAAFQGALNKLWRQIVN